MTSKQRRQGVRMCVKRESDKIVPILSNKAPLNVSQLQLSLTKLESYQASLQTLDVEVLNDVSDETKIESEILETDEYNDTLLDCVARAKIMIQTAAQSSQTQNFSPNITPGTQKHNLRLPKLELSQFSGDPLEFQSFWDSFESSVHKNESLSSIDKFNYLRGLLAGDALKAVEGYRLTAANYESVVETLRERFGDKQVAIFGHFEAMLALSPSLSHDVGSLQNVADECERHIRSLVALGLDESTFGQVFTPIMLSKLPKFVKIELHRKNGSQAWSLSHLREWLKDEIRAREMGERSFGESRPTPSDNTNSSKSRDSNGKTSRYSGRRQSSASALVSNAARASSAKSEQKGASALVSSAAQNEKKCVYCSEAHYSDKCDKYPDVDSRRPLVNNRCFSCLGSGHQAVQCRRRVPCIYCRKKGHHRSLCYSKFGSSARSGTSDRGDVGLNVNAESVLGGCPVQTPTDVNAVSSESKRTIMQTAVAKLVNEKSQSQVSARMLFDTAGSRSFITDRKCAELQLPVVGHEMVSIAGFQSTKRRTSKYKIVEFLVKCADGKFLRVTASVVPTITCPIQKIPIDVKKFPMIKDIAMADPPVERPEFVDIDVLIGLDYYYEFVTGERIQCPGGPLLLASRLGYIATGRINTTATGPETIAVMLLNTNPTHIAERDSRFEIERFWDLEEIGMKEPPKQLSGDDDALLSHSKSLQRSEDGRYVSRWPWRCESPDLPDNFDLAFGRLTSLLKKFAKHPDVFDAYKQILSDQLEKSVIEIVPQEPTGPTVYYMPHHCVITPTKTTTKVRVVYDASSKSRKDVPSLNDCLHRGPVMLEDLCGLLMRFRLQQVALVSDIEKAFLQIGLNTVDRDATRFLWVNDPSMPPVGSNLVIYRFCRIPFGVISSPFVLANTMCQHLQRTGGEVATKILKNHYVDNVITGECDVKSAIDHYREAKTIFSSACMNLREWYSNSTDVRDAFQEADRGKDLEPKVLGVRWDCQSDQLHCESLKPSDNRLTKRQILKSVAQVFDPLGLFAPVTVMNKMLIQDLWKAGCNWDDDVPNDILKRWSKIRDALAGIPVSGVPRFIGLKGDGTYELHVFCDASMKCCAAVVYLKKTTLTSLQSSSDLVIAKTRLSPVKTVQTIPRLELVGVVLGVRLVSFVEEQMRVPIKRKVLWTDSQCTLHWIKRERVSTRFVENRLEEIRKHKDVEFRFVPSEDNPADLPSRGCDNENLVASRLWWGGPQWLTGSEAAWPSANLAGVNGVENTVVAADESTDSSHVLASDRRLIDAERFSSLDRLLRTTAYVLRFVSNARKRPDERNLGPVSVDELQKARTWWHSEVQAQHYPGLVNHNGPTWPQGIGRQLHLFKDECGVLRCCGRIDNTTLSYDAKYPVLLPRDSCFAKLVVLDCHKRVLHSGVAQTLSLVRQAYWIVQGRNMVRKTIGPCRVCRRVEGGPYRIPSPPSLPQERVSEAPPFTYTGLDYLGPLLVKGRDGVARKVWVCLYTCMVVRAVFLDVVEDLSAEQFLLSLRRFMALCGTPRYILSDNASQFHASDRLIQKLWLTVVNSDTVQNSVANRRIKWDFVVEFAPWMGGFYERLVGTVKRALKKVLHNAMVSPTELVTVVCEIASVVNSRPLVYSENEVGHLPLTPANFLSQGTRQPLSLPELEDDYVPRAQNSHDLVLKWKRLQTMCEHFWAVWRNQYLLSLRERDVSHKQRNCSSLLPQVNSVVHVKDGGSRMQWKLGRVTKLHPSRDGQLRSATLRLSNGRQIRRPLKLLFPLEFGDDVVSEDAVKDNSVSPASPRPKRGAAMTAKDRISKMFADDTDV